MQQDLEQEINNTSGSSYRQLPQVAQRLWQVGGAFRVAIEAGFVLLLLSLPPGLMGRWWVWALFGVAVILLGLLQIGYVPKKRWQNWYYRLAEDKIELGHGVWVRRKILVPMKRVQHVDTRQGPLQKRLKLAAVTVHTAATTHEIPALEEDRAAEVRDIISQYTRQALEQHDL